MIKNMEWGAVAYLKQSKYGLGTTDIGINNNSNSTTGCGASAGSSMSSSCSAYNTSTGMLASTTGNIYGIYDMSGGAQEHVMGNMVNTSNQFFNSSAGFVTPPATKYYDSYTYVSSSETTHSRGRLGDATKETMETFGNEIGGWYEDYTYFPNTNNSWFLRGMGLSSGNKTGIFGSWRTTGGNDAAYTSRSVIVED